MNHRLNIGSSIWDHLKRVIFGNRFYIQKVCLERFIDKKKKTSIRIKTRKCLEQNHNFISLELEILNHWSYQPQLVPLFFHYQIRPLLLFHPMIPKGYIKNIKNYIDQLPYFYRFDTIYFSNITFYIFHTRLACHTIDTKHCIGIWTHRWSKLSSNKIF